MRNLLVSLVILFALASAANAVPTTIDNPAFIGYPMGTLDAPTTIQYTGHGGGRHGNRGHSHADHHRGGGYDNGGFHGGGAYNGRPHGHGHNRYGYPPYRGYGGYGAPYGGYYDRRPQYGIYFGPPVAPAPWPYGYYQW